MNAFDPAIAKKIVFDPGTPCNVPDEVFLRQVAINIRRGLPQLQIYQPNPKVALLVAGGPSLSDSVGELREAVNAGGVIVTVNGAYQWCIDNGFRPSMQIVLDAREFNKRFVEAEVPGCKYMIASQCHPKTFEALAGRDVTIWHAVSAGDPEVELLKAYYFDRFLPVTIGTTVTVRAISLLTMLGFNRQDIFGFDSCWLGDKHHAYDQPENNDLRVRVWLRPEGRDDLAESYECAPWHAKQAEDFLKLIRERGNHFELNVRGPGLIAGILRTGASIQMEGSSD